MINVHVSEKCVEHGVFFNIRRNMGPTANMVTWSTKEYPQWLPRTWQA